MRIAYFDSGLHFDDPNLRWGDPAYLLEPGDPGYVPDPTSASFPASTKTKKHKTTMAKNDYIKTKELAFAAQLTTFKNVIGDYATVLGLSPAQVTAQAADCNRYNYELTVASQYANKSEEWNKWKRFTRYGGDAPIAGVPVEPTLPTLVPAVAAGIEERFRALVRLIKASPNYNSAMGEALGIEGEVEAVPDLGPIKPILKLTFEGGLVAVDWDFQRQTKFLKSIEIHVERGAGTGFNLLTIDTTPGYNDTAPIPGTLTKWSYKAIYHDADGRVGQWSEPVSIAVGG